METSFIAIVGDSCAVSAPRLEVLKIGVAKQMMTMSVWAPLVSFLYNRDADDI
jgi:hypothetical protein